MLLEDVTIDGVNATDGVLFAESPVSVTLRDVTIRNASVPDSAVLWIDDADTTVLENVRIENSTGDVGVVHWVGQADQDFTADGLELIGNTGATVGGLYLQRYGANGVTESVVERSLFCDNTATDATYHIADLSHKVGRLRVSNSVFAFGQSTPGVALLGPASFVQDTVVDYDGTFLSSVTPPSGVEIRNSAFVDVVTPVWSFTNAAMTGGYNGAWSSGVPTPSLVGTDIWAGVVDADPRFASYGPSVSCEDLSLMLQPGSPFRDAGDPSISDLDGSRSDIGAYGGLDSLLVDADGDGVYEDLDCDDTNPAIKPGATEVWYDGVDQDCDGANDYDQDGDGFVHSDYSAEVGDLAIGDCDDSDPAIKPGATETWYDGVDQDCDGANDYDQDGDGVVHEGYNAQAGGLLQDDCDDTDASINPEATETWYDGVDQDCDNRHDYDQDLDGYVPSEYSAFRGVLETGDCDDQNYDVHPGVVESWYNGVDQDCDGANDYDQDGDGYVHSDFSEHAGSLGTGDCDDEDDTILPGATDTWYDGVDQDCDGANDYDQDGDGYVHSAFDAFAGALGTGDCDDLNIALNPGATEVWYDGVDQDCDGASDYDQDGDGRDSDQHGGDDCDDLDRTILPGAAEVWYDGVDQDCDGANDYDQDGDGYVHSDHDAEAGQLAVGDCEDTDATVHPDATETWYDGVDQDCDGRSDYDQDGDGEDCDGSLNPECGQGSGGDCVDDPAGVDGLPGNQIYPGAPESWYDGVDQDCDGADDYDQDGDGHASLAEGAGDDCDDTQGTIYPGAPEVDGDSIDQDCDGSDGGADTPDDTDEPGDTDTNPPKGGGCSAVGSAGSAVWMLALPLLGWRRRR